MPQMAMVVSAASRSTSNSISYQPSSERSTSTWPIGLAASPWAIRSRASASSMAKPPPPPPSVKAGRTTTGAFEVPDEGQPVLQRLDHGALRDRLADTGDQAAKAATILGRSHRGQRRAQHPDAVPLQHAGVVQRHRQVQPGLSAERRQQRIRLVLGDHLLQVSHR